MLLPTIRRWLAVVVMSLLLVTMSLPLAMAPSVALAQGNSISVVPNSGPTNTLVKSTGDGWPANDPQIQIWFDQTYTGKTTSADTNGHFSVNFNVPSNATSGLHPVWALDGRESASTPFTVTQQKLSIASIAVDDQNWQPKKVFNTGDQARFVVYVHNPSNFPDSATLKTTVISGNGYTLLSSSPWNVTIPGNSTPGYAWAVTIPQTAPTGIYYYHVIVSDSQGSVDGWAVFQIVNVKADHAIAWAKSQLGSQYWNWRCEVFVENAYGTQYQYLTAQYSYNALHTSTNWSPNLGSLVWFKPNAGNKWAGHVGLYIGNGQFISATASGVKIYDMTYWSNNIAPYEGWGDAPAWWPGR